VINGDHDVVYFFRLALRYELNKRKLSLTQLHKISGVPKTSTSNFLLGKSCMRWVTQRRLAEALETDHLGMLNKGEQLYAEDSGCMNEARLKEITGVECPLKDHETQQIITAVQLRILGNQANIGGWLRQVIEQSVYSTLEKILTERKVKSDR